MQKFHEAVQNATDTRRKQNLIPECTRLVHEDLNFDFNEVDVVFSTAYINIFRGLAPSAGPTTPPPRRS